MKAPKSIVTFVSIAVVGIFLAVYYSSGQASQQQPTSQQQPSSQQPASSANQTETSDTNGSTEPQTQPATDPVWFPNQRLQTVHKDKMDVVYINAKQGWKMVPSQGAMNSEPVTLYRTTDGGQNWSKIAVANQKNVSASESTNLPAGTLPYEGVKNGLGFVSSSTGWLTGYSPRVGYQWIFLTNDGGRTWVHQELPVPSDIPKYTSMSFDLTPPTFFTSEDGLLVENIASAPRNTTPPSYVFFLTQDGGQHWKEQSSSSRLSVTFPNSDPNQSGRSFTVTLNGITWQTADGGYRWTK